MYRTSDDFEVRLLSATTVSWSLSVEDYSSPRPRRGNRQKPLPERAALSTGSSAVCALTVFRTWTQPPNMSVPIDYQALVRNISCTLNRIDHELQQRHSV